jgi:hypothetical protein
MLGCAELGSQSEIQHDFGKTRVENSSFTPCKAPKQVPGYSRTVAYLQELKNHIAKANPDTFKDHLDSKNICVNLSLRDSGIGGGAFGSSGDILIERLSVKQAGSEAAIASLMCHELAHVAVNHQSGSEFSADNKQFNFTYGRGAERYFPVVTQKPVYREARQRIDSLLSSIKEAEFSRKRLESRNDELILSILPPDILAKAQNEASAAKQVMETLRTCQKQGCAEFRSNWDKLERLILQLERWRHTDLLELEFGLYRAVESVVPKDVFITWQEREADEVGLELCARAGFDQRALIEWHVERMNRFGPGQGLNNYTHCRAVIDKAMTGITRNNADPFLRSSDIALIGEFGGRHPQDCWRIFNLERELKVHSTHYAPFAKGVMEALPGKLKEAKAEISAMGVSPN